MTTWKLVQFCAKALLPPGQARRGGEKSATSKSVSEGILLTYALADASGYKSSLILQSSCSSVPRPCQPCNSIRTRDMARWQSEARMNGGLARPKCERSEERDAAVTR